MTINEVLAQADELEPNVYSDEIKAGWLKELDGRLAVEVLGKRAGLEPAPTETEDGASGMPRPTGTEDGASGPIGDGTVLSTFFRKRSPI